MKNDLDLLVQLPGLFLKFARYAHIVEVCRRKVVGCVILKVGDSMVILKVVHQALAAPWVGSNGEVKWGFWVFCIEVDREAKFIISI